MTTVAMRAIICTSCNRPTGGYVEDGKIPTEDLCAECKLLTSSPETQRRTPEARQQQRQAEIAALRARGENPADHGYYEEEEPEEPENAYACGHCGSTQVSEEISGTQYRYGTIDEDGDVVIDSDSDFEGDETRVVCRDCGSNMSYNEVSYG